MCQSVANVACRAPEMAPLKTVELRPDRRKLRPKFDGYKLSLDPIPILKYEIPSPEQVRTSEKQFSFLHAGLFGLHNHLVSDPWQPNSAYFFDATWTLQKIIYDSETGKVKPFTPVMKLLRPKEEDERYPISLEFVSDELAVVGDGCGTLIVVETGNRGQSDEFKAKQRFEPVEGPFVVREAQLNEEEKTISCVLVQIQQAQDHFESVLHWTRVRRCEGIWSLLESKVLKTRGAVSYCALESSGEALLVATDFPIEFLSNLQKVSEEKSEDEEKEDTEKMEKEMNAFSWTQTDEDVTINFDRQSDSLKQDYEVRVTKNEIAVSFKGTPLLQGALFGPIDVETTTWTMQNDNLQVLLIKETPESWAFLVPGSPEEEKNTTQNPSGPALFASQMEECDFGPAGDSERENYLSRLVWSTEETSNQVYLGSNPPLFEVRLRPGHPKAVALKHDVDACVWEHLPKPTDPWTLSHEETIDAFGYVLASKQQRKFVACAPNVDYVVVAEAERHVFIYKKGYQGSNLRNRTGVPVNIGQQKLVTLDAFGEVVGISVENDVTLLLTTSYLVCLQLRIEE